VDFERFEGRNLFQIIFRRDHILHTSFFKCNRPTTQKSASMWQNLDGHSPVRTEMSDFAAVKNVAFSRFRQTYWGHDVAYCSYLRDFITGFTQIFSRVYEPGDNRIVLTVAITRFNSGGQGPIIDRCAWTKYSSSARRGRELNLPYVICTIVPCRLTCFVRKLNLVTPIPYNLRRGSAIYKVTASRRWKPIKHSNISMVQCTPMRTGMYSV